MTKDAHDTKTAIRVLIADDSPLLRDALDRFLSEVSGIEVVGLSSGGREALALAPEVRPDVVLMDLTMRDLDGLAATRLLKASSPAPAVVICTLEDDEEVRRAAREAGADALVRKRDLVRELEGVLLSLARRAGSAQRKPPP